MVFFIVFGLTATAFIVGFDNMQTYSMIIVTRNVNEVLGLVLNHSIAEYLINTL